MGDARQVEKIGAGCFLTGTAASVILIGSLAIGGIRYLNTLSKAVYSKGDKVIAQELLYSPAESANSKINREYHPLSRPTECIVDKLDIDFFTEDISYRLGCPSEKNPDQTIYGWLPQYLMPKK